MAGGLWGWWRRRRGKSAPSPLDDYRFDKSLRGDGFNFDNWWEALDAKPRLPMELAAEPQRLEALRNEHPEEAAATIRSAERVLEHRFQLLGSPEYVPADPDRGAPEGNAPGNGYQPIDWYWDPVSELRFPRGVPYKEWDLYAMRPGNADIKLPWELGRCQHWVTLAQAFLLSGRDEFAREIQNQMLDFREANPVGMGIQWTCTMDVAIRAVNWSIALRLLAAANPLDASFWHLAYESLFELGGFIRTNLEDHYEVTSNHFLSNVIGLHFLGALFRDLAHGREWDKFAREALEREIQTQVLADGADFESSVPYHRLVTEMFLASARLADFQDRPLSDTYRNRLAQMVDYHHSILRPDGCMPQLGDADDGRLHIFTEYGRWNPQDGRHLLVPATAILSNKEWLRDADERGRWEATWWGILKPAKTVARPRSGWRHFPEAGVTCSVGPQHYLAVTNARVGTEGFGNHKHNDQLSFEFHGGGVPWIVDPGSHVYTGNPDSRNRFRSTAFHNTVCIDGEEQNEFNEEWLFRMFEKAEAEHLLVRETSDGGLEYAGKHKGYERLESGVLHKRCIRLLTANSGAPSLAILDQLTGSGTHTCDWHFHFAPGVVATRIDDTTLELQANDLTYHLQHCSSLRGDPGPSSYSPSYGVLRDCAAVDLRFEGELSGQHHWWFQLFPAESNPDWGARVESSMMEILTA